MLLKLVEEKITTISCIIPARNEGGHLLSVVSQAMSLKEIDRIIIIEGGSTDNTWEVAQGIKDSYPDKIEISQQKGTGKFNAVLEGSQICSSELILIWDADGTVPLEDTERIVKLALQTGKPVIGDRLRGIIAKGAMQPANWFGNWMFALLWSPLIRKKPTDMLCGTKIFPTPVFREMPKWLIKHDPYGDFALVAFARARDLEILSSIVDYKARSYGVTNINRWSGAIQLFHTTFKVYLGFASNKIFKRSFFHE